MVKKIGQSEVDYAEEYDQYWSADDRFGEVSSDLATIADHLVMTCGISKVLDIGSGEGRLVSELLRRGVDAYGLDVSQTVVDRCNQRIPGRFTQGTVLELPFADEAFHTVVSTDCMEHLSAEDIPQALAEIYRVSKHYVFLQIATTKDRDGHWHLTVEDRNWWELRCFEAGFRKHPAYYTINDYEALNHDGWQIYILLEKIPRDVLMKYPMSTLAAERDLHMDMLRESGSRSDAHVGRYHFASKYIRPGDVVVDAACGLGYGLHLLRALSAGSSFRGIDGSRFAIDYAFANFSMPGSVEFSQGDLPEYLTRLEDNSVDVIVSFETLEHVKSPEQLLKEFWRVLTPGGRLIVSVPNDWSDETGKDPNPYHFHVYDSHKFQTQLNHLFEIEHLFGQTADRVKLIDKNCEWASRPRSLKEVDLSKSEPNVEAEWLLAVAAKSPLEGRNVPYIEKMYSLAEIQAAGNALAFGRDYENPWIIKSLISIGLRTENKSLRAKWAQETLEVSSMTSADRGAALCVLAYLELAGTSVMPVDALEELIDQFLGCCRNKKNPNVLRWSVSLRYVQALISMANGQRERAKELLESIIATPILAYHATLLTKTAESAYHLGVLTAADGGFKTAQSIWRNAFDRLNQLMVEHLERGYSELPPDFEIRELSSVLALMGRLCVASKYIESISHRPSQFYAQCNADYVALQNVVAEERMAFEMLNAHSEANQSYIFELIKGKDWLEAQWRTSQEQLSRRDSELTELRRGKDWLESQWLASQEEISRLKNTLGFRLLRKLRLLKNRWTLMGTTIWKIKKK